MRRVLRAVLAAVGSVACLSLLPPIPARGAVAAWGAPEDRPEMVRWFQMRQSFNLPGIQAMGLIFKNPAMLIPHVQISSIDRLDLQCLRSMGVECVVFDKDNTLSYCYSSELHPSAVAVVKQAKDLFSSNVAILSNSVGSCDDPDFSMALETEQRLGIEVIKHRVKKPGCLREVLQHFESRGGRPVRPDQICVIGDRLLTDVAFANTHGMKSVLVAPLSYWRDHPLALVLRLLEVKVLLPIMRLLVGANAIRRDGEM